MSLQDGVFRYASLEAEFFEKKADKRRDPNRGYEAVETSWDIPPHPPENRNVLVSFCHGKCSARSETKEAESC